MNNLQPKKRKSMQISIDTRLLVVSDFEIEGGAENVANQTRDILADDVDVETHYGSARATKPASPFSYVYSREQSARLLEKLKAFKPQIVHVHNYYHLLSPSILNALKRYRKFCGANRPSFVFTAHDYHFICPQSGFCHFKGEELINFPPDASMSSMLMKRLDRRGATYSALRKMQWLYNYQVLRSRSVFDVVVAPSKFLFDRFASRIGSERVRLIRYPFDTKPAAKIESRTAKEDPLRLVFLGRVDPEKGVLQLIDAIRSMNRDDVHLTIIGEGEHFECVKQLIANESLEDRVVTTGRVPPEKVHGLLPSFDALILPSLWYENAPLVIIEGALAGLRLVLSEWGGLHELGQLCEDSHYFNPNCSESVKNAISACRQAIINKTPSQRDYETLTSEFSREKYRSEILELFSSL